MGKKGKGKSKSAKKSAPRKAAAKSKSIAKANKAKSPAPAPPPPPPPIEEQIITPPQISVSTNPVERINQIMHIPDIKTYDDEDEDEAPTFTRDDYYDHGDDCACRCCSEY